MSIENRTVFLALITETGLNPWGKVAVGSLMIPTRVNKTKASAINSITDLRRIIFHKVSGLIA